MKTNILGTILVMFLTSLVQVSAEFNVSCDSEMEHRCDDGSCIPSRTLCDGVPNCPDGSDEKQNSTLDDDLVPCTRLHNRTDVQCFIPSKYVCDGIPHCLEDECDCPWSFKCSDDACIPENYFCDGIFDCSNNADELVHRNNVTDHIRCQGFFISQPCSLPPAKICDGETHCIFNEDECFCDGSRGDTGVLDSEVIFDSDCFRCLDGNGGILQSHMCDVYFQCSDLSDECLCRNPIPTCEQLEYEGSCEFRCLPDQLNATHCIEKTQVCDGIRDCFVGEDEKYCSGVFFMSQVSYQFYEDEEMPEFWCCNAGYTSDCIYPHTSTNATYDGCDQFYECPKDDGGFEKLKYAIKCDGVRTCESGKDECNEDCLIDGNLPPYCYDDSDTLTFNCPGTNDKYYLTEMCNGYPACDTELGPEAFDEKDCPDRLYCTAPREEQIHVNIPKSHVCDCFPDCTDGADEANCTGHSLFCCSAGNEGVPLMKVCDGIADCFDESDECQSCIVSPFADDGHIIKSKPLQAFVWITGTASTIGNIFMIAHTVKNLATSRSNKIRINNSIQVIGLAIADCSVGIYLLSLGIVNAVYSGEYCYVDYSWRSGNACNAMGVVSTLGIEASVFMLTTITASRLHTVTRPFSTPPGARRTLLFLAIVYTTALFLAILPIIPSTKDYFVENIRLTKNPFLQRTINREEFSEFANKLTGYGNDKLDISATLGKRDGIHSWDVLYEVMNQLNDTFEPKFEFGFYSTHGVCLPKFFPDSVSSSRHYSLLLVSVNFVSFIFILVSYLIIFMQRVHSVANAGQNTDLTTLQRKITRIIVTDFLCWMPICLITFLKFAGVWVSEDVYEVAAIVILPINSALNPFLYSQLPDLMWTVLNRVYRRMKGIDESNALAGTSSRSFRMTTISTVADVSSKNETAPGRDN